MVSIKLKLNSAQLVQTIYCSLSFIPSHPIPSLSQLLIQTRPLETEAMKDKGIHLGRAESW